MTRAALAIAGAAVVAAFAWFILRAPRAPRGPGPVEYAPPSMPLARKPGARQGAVAGGLPQTVEPVLLDVRALPGAEAAAAARPSRTSGEAIDARRDAAGKVAILDEIFNSRNDNDPRLDREFKNLTPEAKASLRARYRHLPPERRNDRGTIVFLLANNLTTAEDWNFLQNVVSEPPCLSMSDCAKPPAGQDPEPNVEITLVYPQLVALSRLEEMLRRVPPAEAAREASRVIRAAESSASPIVAAKAAQLPHRF
ncbi:MAG: hypothetical protein HY078_16400 [Elusimicrobia bacterium]|nr:hypothetical protein [Elusimicrobiota bacterium]